MTKRMLIDGSHPEEVRVVITDGNRLDEYDIETSTKTQLKGNIYLAKVTRVEPSLQAAFVDYGGGRHGFLAFSEIHPDYYQIPIEDREALKQDLAQLEGKAQAAQAHVEEIDGDVPDADDPEADEAETDEPDPEESAGHHPESDPESDEVRAAEADENADAEADAVKDSGEHAAAEDDHFPEDPGALEDDEAAPEHHADDSFPEDPGAPEAADEEAKPRKGRERRGNPMRRYKIQEVIKRRQILLVQVVKEERGNKGAAITTYLSLAGRYCVLMPNASRSGGGVSRKITSAADRRRLRDLLKDLNVPEGMGVIMRTAGMQRNKSEIKRDFDYLMRLWEDVRALTLQSAAPALVYEEGDLIKRAIRDLYTRDIEEVSVEGTEAYQAAKKLMRMMMPSHAKRVQPYRDTIPLFHRYQVETQLESMHNPVVQLKSGGYIVIDTTEALVAIDVNSGRSTRERNIEETAVKTNLEAATEIARQLRLRDLAGLIVIDFIDMEENRNQRAVEKRMKEAVKTDRARIQLGRISTFGLFELSRQRLRPSLIETSTDTCPNCHGTGFVRSIESTALHVLRMIEEEGIRMRSSELSVAVPVSVALYMLNQKRDTLIGIENRYGFKVSVTGDDTLIPPDMRIERTKSRQAGRPADTAAEEPAAELAAEDADVAADEDDTDKEPARKRRPRRRRRKEPAAAGETGAAEHAAEATSDEEAAAEESAGEAAAEGAAATGERSSRRRRRGRRGGRRRNQKPDASTAETAPDAGSADEQPDENAAETAADTGSADERRDENAAETAPNAGASANGGSNGSGLEPEKSPRHDDDLSDSSPAPTVEGPPEPAPIEVDSAIDKPTAPATQDQPRRGWWQRLME